MREAELCRIAQALESSLAKRDGQGHWKRVGSRKRARSVVRRLRPRGRGIAVKSRTGERNRSSKADLAQLRRVTGKNSSQADEAGKSGHGKRLV